MIPPTPGADPSSRMFGEATPPDGAGPLGPDQWWPTPSGVTFKDVLHALNPLQHLPGVGMIYRAATGDDIPHPLRILGAGILGGPAGMLGSALFGLVTEIVRLGPDHSRSPVPAGFSMTGSEAQVEPVTPGTVTGKDYISLATAEPEFIANSEQALLAEGAPQRALTAYATAVNDYRTYNPSQGMG